MARRRRKERAGSCLVVAKRLAVALQHVLFERRDAGHMNQQPVHADRSAYGGKAPRIAAADIDREQTVGKPAEPFEEVVGMTRPSPQSLVTDRDFVGGCRAEAAQLRI